MEDDVKLKVNRGYINATLTNGENEEVVIRVSDDREGQVDACIVDILVEIKAKNKTESYSIRVDGNRDSRVKKGQSPYTTDSQFGTWAQYSVTRPKHYDFDAEKWVQGTEGSIKKLIGALDSGKVEYEKVTEEEQKAFKGAVIGYLMGVRKFLEENVPEDCSGSTTYQLSDILAIIDKGIEEMEKMSNDWYKQESASVYGF